MMSATMTKKAKGIIRSQKSNYTSLHLGLSAEILVCAEVSWKKQARKNIPSGETCMFSGQKLQNKVSLKTESSLVARMYSERRQVKRVKRNGLAD